MNETRTRLLEDSVVADPWPPWSKWAIWEWPELGCRLWVSFRYRTVRQRVVTQDEYFACEKVCSHPEWSAFGCRHPEYRNPHSPYNGARGYMIHTSKITRRSDPKTDDYEWIDWEWRTRTVSKLTATLENATSKVRLAAAARGAPHRPLPDERFAVGHTLSLPALCEGERLTLGGADDEYALEIDGVQRQPGRQLKTSDLGIGLHVIDLADRTESDESRAFQLQLSVVSPIEVRVVPVTEITLDDEHNGAQVRLELHNRSRSEHCVRVGMESTPAGWMATPLGAPFYVLKQEESVSVTLVVERMFAADLIDEPLAFTVRCSMVATQLSDVHTTFYVLADDRTGEPQPPERPTFATWAAIARLGER